MDEQAGSSDSACTAKEEKFYTARKKILYRFYEKFDLVGLASGIGFQDSPYANKPAVGVFEG